MKIASLFLVLFPLMLNANAAGGPYSKVWVSDMGNGSYKNPILYADYSDPDVIRVGDDYYMTSSSFNCVPGLQILHSKDLVNWSIVGAALPYSLSPDSVTSPQHGKRVWAPCIRYHKGEYYIFWGDPDQGAFMVKTKDPRGDWSTPVLVKAGKGIIDTSPLWDDDGRVYMVHAYAASRAAFNSVIAICELNAEATHAISPSRIVFDGRGTHEICEGPKFYKRNGYYYIFTPAGGVWSGWQTVLRSKTIYGPYEDKIVLAQGNTSVNGPHQGAWVDTKTGENWFFHFQDVGAAGRLVHLQPMTWKNDWPVIGNDNNGDGCGEPFLEHKKPNVGKTYPLTSPQESDEFNNTKLGLQWQWHGNMNEKWHFCHANEGVLRLYCYPVPETYRNLWDVSNLLLQKIPAPDFTVTTKVKFTPHKSYTGERAGLLVMGLDYSALLINNTEQGVTLTQVQCIDADKGNVESINAAVNLAKNEEVYLRVKFSTTGQTMTSPGDGHKKIMICKFSYSLDGKNYISLGETFNVRQGRWIGAKVGVFAQRPREFNDSGYADFDWFRIEQ